MNENIVKIRSYSSSGIQSILRQFPKILNSTWTKLLPFNLYTKEFINFISTNNFLTITSPTEGQKFKNNFAVTFKMLYSQPSLAWLLLFDESPKVRASVCKIIITIIDGIKVDNLLINIDGEKLDRSKLDPYKSIMHQVYQCLKNLNMNLLAALMVESDQFVLNQILKVSIKLFSDSYSLLINSKGLGRCYWTQFF